MRVLFVIPRNPPPTPTRQVTDSRTSDRTLFDALSALGFVEIISRLRVAVLTEGASIATQRV
jgi:hypothetical protein